MDDGTMKQKKIIFLFLALLFPICIFIFLKLFGKNEFAVPALYADVYPDGLEDCGIEIMLPYSIPDSVRAELSIGNDSLILIHVGELAANSQQQIDRVKKEYGNEIKLQILSSSDKSLRLKSCIFFLQDPYDLVLVDHKGVIRGQYILNNREEIDRLLIELAILFKRY